MAKKLFPQRTADTRYSSRYVQSFPVNLPAEKIDLYKWATEMTDSDYTSYSPAHKAMVSFTRDNIFYMKNVENIGTDTLVQYYELKYHTPGHIQFYSSGSRAYIMRWFPATVAVPWELYVQPVSADNSRLVCMIGTDFPNLLLKAAAWFSGLAGFFLSRHLQKEGRAFALDIEEKFMPQDDPRFNKCKIENTITALHAFELPAIKEVRGETIFNPANFLGIYDRVDKIKSGAQRQWGKMNLVQMLNHLKIATGSGMGVYKLNDESSFLWRTIIKFVVLNILKRLPKNAKAPEGFKREMNKSIDFNTEKEKVLIILKKAYSSTNNTYPHPSFGIMSRAEWGKLIYRHFDHHLRQFDS